jgi:hypothetical protein
VAAARRKPGRRVLTHVLGSALLLLIAAGSTYMALRKKPTCENVVAHVSSLYPEALRRALEGFGDRTYECRELEWSPQTRACMLAASSMAEADRCPQIWLKAPVVCKELVAAVSTLAQRCRLTDEQAHRWMPTVPCERVARIRDLATLRQGCIPALGTLECASLGEAQVPEGCREQLLY